MTADPSDVAWTRVCSVEDIPDDEGLRLDVDPPISLFRSEGEVFALDDSCTHETYSLAEGFVEKCMVECPLHLAKFDLRTGKALTMPATVPVRTHPVQVTDGDVYLHASTCARVSP